jgi:hypothetical protein
LVEAGPQLRQGPLVGAHKQRRHRPEEHPLDPALDTGRPGAQVGGRRARVGGQQGHRQIVGPEEAVELEGEQQVGELGLGVRGPALVAPPLPVQVFDVDATPAVADAGYGDHPALRRGEQRQHEPGEGVMAKVVRADLALEAVLGPRQRGGHDAGVVDQQRDGGV